MSSPGTSLAHRGGGRRRTGPSGPSRDGHIRDLPEVQTEERSGVGNRERSGEVRSEGRGTRSGKRTGGRGRDGQQHRRPAETRRRRVEVQQRRGGPRGGGHEEGRTSTGTEGLGVPIPLCPRHVPLCPRAKTLHPPVPRTGGWVVGVETFYVLLY